MSAPKLSNNILQKELAFIGHWSGTVVESGRYKRPGILPRRLFRQCGASVVTARDAAVNRTEIRSCRRRLTDTQLVLLSTAAQHSDSAAGLAGYPKGAVPKKAITRLLEDRLVEEILALPVWRRDDGQGRLR